MEVNYYDVIQHINYDDVLNTTNWYSMWWVKGIYQDPKARFSILFFHSPGGEWRVQRGTG